MLYNPIISQVWYKRFYNILLSCMDFHKMIKSKGQDKIMIFGVIYLCFIKDFTRVFERACKQILFQSGFARPVLYLFCSF